jgi:hypothetical protein
MASGIKPSRPEGVMADKKHVDDLWLELDQLGLEEVRKRKAGRIYGGWKRDTMEQWLLHQESKVGATQVEQRPLPQRIIENLLKRPLIAGIVVVATIVASIAGFKKQTCELYAFPYLCKPGGPGFEIVRFYPDDQLSSFEEVMEPDFAKEQGSIRTIVYNPRLESARKSGRCIGVDGEKPIKSVLPLLDERLKRLGREDLRPHVRDIASYRQMMSTGGLTFLDIAFTEVELSRMRFADPANFEAVVSWVVRCVGVRHPVITVLLRNNSGKTIVLSEIHYLVEKAFITQGAAAAAVTPVHTYNHVLPHRDGEHHRPLNPPFMLETGAVGAFSLVLRPDTEGPGLTWTMRLAVSDTDGNRAVTERFQLIMSKLPPQ